jgi:hypothetical protein
MSRAGSLVAAAERRIKYYTKPDRPVYIKDLLLRFRTSNCLGNEGLWDVKIEDFFETVDAGVIACSQLWPNLVEGSLSGHANEEGCYQDRDA